MRGATLFSGGRGVEMLLKDDIDFIYSVEFDPAIAAVGAQLGGHTIVSDVRLVDYSTWGALDYGHASPVCKEFSQGKSGGAESQTDIECAQAVCRFLRACTPRVFTLENVSTYARSRSFRLIIHELTDLGYMSAAEIVNSADYGVPQTRRRLIVRAVRDALLPCLPAPLPWRGWFDAVKDLLPTLPRKAMPGRLQHAPINMLVDQLNSGHGDVTMRHIDQPSFTLSIYSKKHPSPRFRLDSGDYATNVRATARLQSVPDWYALPESDLGGVIVGNMAPPLLMRNIVLPLL